MSRSEKIRPEHLARPAFVYVRQSTVDQVRHHQESRRRQYDLAAHARALGWQEVVVIDEDLGKSGATTVGRTGFQRLVAEVSLGRAGAVLSLVKIGAQVRVPLRKVWVSLASGSPQTHLFAQVWANLRSVPLRT
jgi:Resolvase, N terminal domain